MRVVTASVESTSSFQITAKLVGKGSGIHVCIQECGGAIGVGSPEADALGEVVIPIKEYGSKMSDNGEA